MLFKCSPQACQLHSLSVCTFLCQNRFFLTSETLANTCMCFFFSLFHSGTNEQCNTYHFYKGSEMSLPKTEEQSCANRRAEHTPELSSHLPSAAYLCGGCLLLFPSIPISRFTRTRPVGAFVRSPFIVAIHSCQSKAG